MGNATQGSTGHLSGLGSSLAGHRPGGGSWCSGSTGPSGQPVGRGGWSTVQPAGDFITPGPTKLGRTRQLCSSAQSAGAWLLSWKLVAEGPLPWQLAGVTVATVSVELAAAWLLQLVASAGGCSLAGCGLALWWKQYGPANGPCTGIYMAPGSVAFNIFQPEGKPFPFCLHGFRSCLGWATLFGVLCNGLQYCWNLVWVDMDSSGSLEDLKN